MDLISSRSIVVFSSVSSSMTRSAASSIPVAGFDHDRPGHLFLQDADRPYLDQFQHREKGHHHVHAGFGFVEEQLE